MYAKTPSSLKWLISKQTRLAGEILLKQNSLDRMREQIAAFEKEIIELHEQKRQIEAVMQMHEIRINAEELRPIRPQYNPFLLGYGGVTRLIYKVLRQSENGTASTKNIVEAVLAAIPSHVASDRSQVEHIKARVRTRLCVMVKRGMLTKSHDRGSHEPCVWHLATARPPAP